jgi:hypothetical protein
VRVRDASESVMSTAFVGSDSAAFQMTPSWPATSLRLSSMVVSSSVGNVSRHHGTGTAEVDAEVPWTGIERAAAGVAMRLPPAVGGSGRGGVTGG